MADNRQRQVDEGLLEVFEGSYGEAVSISSQGKERDGTTAPSRLSLR